MKPCTGGRRMMRFMPHGPRGAMMLGFALIGLFFGRAYIYDPRAASGLEWLTQLVPLYVFGWLWVISGVWLSICAFRLKQAGALSIFSALCFLWGTSYSIASFINIAHDHALTGHMLIPIFYGLTVACGAAVRLQNPAPSHVEIVVKPGTRPNELGGDESG